MSKTFSDRGTHEMQAEITRLRAEVERLKSNTNEGARVLIARIQELERERGAALIEMALLASARCGQCKFRLNDEGFPWPCMSCHDLRVLVAALPTEARALLDRLQRAEAVASQINGLKTALCDSTVVLDNLRRGSHLRIGAEGCLSDEWGIVTTQIHKNQAVLRGEGFAAGEEGKA